MKPVIKFENGMLSISVVQKVDGDKDGKAAGELKLDVLLDAAEVVSEITKKDYAWLEVLLKQIKV